jgi:type IV pilus assembly protein PilQ
MKFPALIPALPFVLALLAATVIVPSAFAEDAAAAPASAAVTVTGAQIGTAADLTVVRIAIESAGGAPTVSPFRQSNPDRLVLDIAGATLAPGSAGPSGGAVTRSEFSSFNDGSDNVRLTMYLDRGVSWDVKAEGGTIVLTLTPGQARDPLAEALGAADAAPATRLSGPQAGTSGPALRTLDFQQRDRVSRVLLGTQDVEPKISQPEPSLITIDLPGATMPESLKRELNSAYFYSAVDSVKAYPTSAGVRIAVRMREGAEYTVAREGALQVLSIQVPADQIAAREAALERGSAVAPSTPATSGGTGLSNAGGGEVLINGRGNAVDAQASMGSGGTGGASELSFASDDGDSSVRYSGRRMSLDLQSADIHAAFRFIAEFADVNIVASDEVKGTVTVRLKDVPWDEALASVLRAKGLAAQRMGHVIRVASIETIKGEQQAALEAQKAKYQMEELQVYIAPLNYASASDLEKQVSSVLSERGSVEIDSRGNQMIIQDTANNVAQARALLRRLDAPTREVRIESRFVEANSNFSRSLGIQWGTDVNASAATGYPTGAFFPNSVGVDGGIAKTTGTSASDHYYSSTSSDSLLMDLGASGETSAISFALGSIPGLVNIDARLSAAEVEGWGKIVSSPSVTALDNEKAKITQGAKIPYLSTSQNGTSVQFITAALELVVTPHITSDRTVFMEIELTNNRPDFGNAVQGQPAISTKEISTRVLVPDGDTAVLGGVYATSESFTTSRVPGLGSIPIIGYLFKNSSKTRSQNEMLVFITPHIVEVQSPAAVSEN